MSSGAKVRTPLTTPISLTSISHRRPWSLFPRRRLLTHHPGVVADEIDAAEPFDGLVGECVQIGVDADISPHPGRMSGLTGQGVDGYGDRVLADVGDHHIDAAPHELVGYREADAAGAAGHYGDLSRIDPHVGPTLHRAARQAFSIALP